MEKGHWSILGAIVASTILLSAVVTSQVKPKTVYQPIVRTVVVVETPTPTPTVTPPFFRRLPILPSASSSGVKK